jgi:hypothetical protein
MAGRSENYKQILRQTRATGALTLFLLTFRNDSRETCPFGYVQLYR